MPILPNNAGQLMQGDGQWHSLETGTNSTSTSKALAASVGKILNDRIDNLESRGKYLSA